MGTNYYFKKNICEHCQREEKEFHIGKSSGGWTFHFRGYRGEWSDIGEEILSLEDWINYIKKTPGKIFNEYGEETSLEELLELIESKREAKFHHVDLALRAAHGDEEARKIMGPDWMDERCWRENAKNHWMDNEGHGFTDWEFS